MVEQWKFNVRAPRVLVDAYDRVCQRRDTARSADLLEYMRRQVREHGDERDLADLDTADAELAQPRRGPRRRRPTP